MTYVISVGTNLGDRKQNIINAIDALNNIPYTDVVKVSSIYQTEPVGYARQDDFYNVVMVVKSQYEPHEMLGICLGIESGLGRIRTIRFGPRVIDLDIIFADNEVINDRNLIVPHERYHERRFVLQPMLEIFPDGKFCDIDFAHHIDSIVGQDITLVDNIDKNIIVED